MVPATPAPVPMAVPCATVMYCTASCRFVAPLYSSALRSMTSTARRRGERGGALDARAGHDHLALVGPLAGGGTAVGIARGRGVGARLRVGGDLGVAAGFGAGFALGADLAFGARLSGLAGRPARLRLQVALGGRLLRRRLFAGAPSSSSPRPRSSSGACAATNELAPEHEQHSPKAGPLRHACLHTLIRTRSCGGFHATPSTAPCPHTARCRVCLRTSAAEPRRPASAQSRSHRSVDG